MTTHYTNNRMTDGSDSATVSAQDTMPTLEAQTLNDHCHEPPAPHIGMRLKTVREARNLHHVEISDHLKIQPSFLAAIEQLDKDALPSVGYVLGYVRAYAEFLGLDGEGAVRAYKTDSAIPQNLGLRDCPHFVPKRQIRLPRGFFPAMTMLSCAAVLAFWYGFGTDAKSSALKTRPSLPASSSVPSKPIMDPDLMTIKATAPSWVEIKNNKGEVIVSRIFVTGERWQADMNAGITLSARDAGALELYLGEDLMGRLGGRGIPMTDIPMPAVPREFMSEQALALTQPNHKAGDTTDESNR